jgi:magnesium transporter
VDPEAPAPAIRVLAYGPDGHLEEDVADVTTLPAYLGQWPVTWVDVCCLGDAAALELIAQTFELHPLVLEDIVNVHQRPKVDDYGDQLFVVARMVSLAEHVETEQLSIVLGRRFVLTFQERPGDVLDPVRDRIRTGHAICRTGPDYLAYALVDAVVDHYFPVLERYGEHLEAVEDAVMLRPEPATLREIQDAKHGLLTLRRAIWPQRDALMAMQRDETALITDDTRVYLRDCYDHAVQVIDMVEIYREIVSGFVEMYLSNLSNRMNEVMKILTIFSTLFIPLTFITGVYGMNFHTDASPWSMPELGWRWGYPFVLAVMGAMAAAMLFYFRRKGWFGSLLAPPPASASDFPRGSDTSRDVGR